MTSIHPTLIDQDRIRLRQWAESSPDTESVAHFKPGPGIERLNLSFDIDALHAAVQEVLDVTDFKGDLESGFGAISLTRRPGVEVETANDLSGLFYTRVDSSLNEVAREERVDESAFTEFVPRFAHTYLYEVWTTLSALVPIGRMRILSKGLYNCNSWHRDPEPRLHIPIVSNPGSLFVVNHHVTHLPADGSVYFTDTRAYHTALNGGESRRIHIVAYLASACRQFGTATNPCYHQADN